MSSQKKSEKPKKDTHWYETVKPGTGVKAKEDAPDGGGKPGDTLSLEKHLAEVHGWVTEIAKEVPGHVSRGRAYSILRVVLPALRDRMPVEEVFQFSAQLPLMIRGLFFEGYDITGKPLKMNREQFLERIEKGLGKGEKVKPSSAFEGVLNVLYSRMSRGELEDIYATLPADLCELWDSCLHPSNKLKN